MQSGRYWARLGLVAVELSLVLLVIVLLLALARQMLTMSYLVMGHDTDYYLGVGREVVAGLVPYRDFSFEYPPLALAPIVLPVALASIVGAQLDSVGYVLLLALENVAVVGATGLCLSWLARRGWSARSPRATFLVYLGLVCATPILFWRFDALPALLTVLALCAVAARRPVASGLAIAAGALTKLYPVVLLPVVPLLAQRRSGCRSCRGRGRNSQGSQRGSGGHDRCRTECCCRDVKWAQADKCAQATSRAQAAEREPLTTATQLDRGDPQ